MNRTIYAVAACGLLEFGCASGANLVPMDPNRPIETEHGYRQDGKDIDPDSMSEVLEREPHAAPALHRAQTLSPISMVLASVGGALIGWPLGQKMGGDPHPTWELAYAGAGTALVALSLAIWADFSKKSAVEAHNRRLAGPEDAGSDESQ